MENFNYEIIQVWGEGTYGIVYKIYEKNSNQYFALKKIKLNDEYEEGIPSTALREISILQELNHPNIIKLYKTLYNFEKKNLEMIFEFMDYDLKMFIKKQKNNLKSEIIKNWMFQILNGVMECHKNRIIHRDLKPQNILINPYKNIIKIADFGLARIFSFPINSLTNEIETLWYRAPEILLGENKYSLNVDIWAIGWIFVELFELKPLFTGNCEIGQIIKIFQFFGTPEEKHWPKVNELPHFKNTFPKFSPKNPKLILKNVDDELALDLILKFLALDPNKRISCKEALEHPYFKNN